MNPSDINNPVWKQLVSGQKEVVLNFLAAKILLSRLQLNVKNNSTTPAVAAQELFDLYMKNQQLPSVKKDVSILLGK